ncbi:Far11p KNAG_0I02190 [Huiozyma naganishii CBS 8797]|uniref:Factor arrest protein 11 n=1 Tax=Huiozyma naganishii (strain ATCC MYA-139 / BCRC 22969 / CBS 8797 / KCTC 17520 / NBRC 10181 / NCYC 3082 / Yp74L-3) TaxID=1071383 RepID=J7RAW8_HUIN7|nr:hypothetical protein KNAG_0I02190 [Kazachstania naganishii CBS 8797]CCK72005.1 hypothetical protein KNAG_0I02190 [Kazachstania naganishii CBS 8797]
MDAEHVGGEKQILRSVSLDSLRPSRQRATLRFRDDTGAVNFQKLRRVPVDVPRDRRDDTLLRDLDSMLRTKLNIGDPALEQIDMDGSHGHQYHPSPVLEPNFNFAMSVKGNSRNSNPLTIKSDTDLLAENLKNATDGEADDDAEPYCDDDEEDFANVDEIDGPIIGRISPSTTPSKTSPVENSARPNAREADFNLPVSETFQKNLDRRCFELNTSHTELTNDSMPDVGWKLDDFYGLESELQDWFTSTDHTYLAQLRSHFVDKIKDPDMFLCDEKYARAEISTMVANLENNMDSNLMALTYTSLGCIVYADDMIEHIFIIKRNNILLVQVLPQLIGVFKKISAACRDDKSNLRRKTTLLFYVATTLFFIISVCIELRDEYSGDVTNCITHISDAGLLKYLTGYIEYWRWNSRLSMRIRNINALLYKALVLQFGDNRRCKEVKRKLYKYHGISHSDDKSNRLTLSPLQFEAFSEDITSRFPAYDMPATPLAEHIDNSNSLSQFLEIPRSKSRNSINASLSVPQQHLATPAPSPPSSPAKMQFSEGLRPRKSFQTNMSYPFLYPFDDDSTDATFREKSLAESQDNSNNNTAVPYSIEEASKILADNLQITLDCKQLWYERDLFMATERGWRDEDDDKLASNPYDYSGMENPQKLEEIEVMKRVSQYYSDCLAGLGSLVFVMLQVIESNLSNINYRPEDFPNQASIDAVQPHLEIIRTKELSLRVAVGVLNVLLKWFKVNHVLKFEHLSLLIYDAKYINICSSLLGKYSENYADKALRKMLNSNYSFWGVCSQEYKTRPVAALDDGRFDTNILSSFAYMLRILRKVTGSKTHRLKCLPLSIGLIFKRYYRLFNLSIYHPILKIIKELTPFKNKRWKSEHMDLISGVYLYERLELVDNWVTGKDIAGELNDACGQEIALRALLQFYNFTHYETAMHDLGYCKKSSSSLNMFTKDSERLNSLV